MTAYWFRRKSIEHTHLRTPSRKRAVHTLPVAYPLRPEVLNGISVSNPAFCTLSSERRICHLSVARRVPGTSISLVWRENWLCRITWRDLSHLFCGEKRKKGVSMLPPVLETLPNRELSRPSWGLSSSRTITNLKGIKTLFFVRLLPQPQPQPMRGAAPTAAVCAVRNAMDERTRPKGAHLDEHPMQRRLIDERAAQHRVVIGVVGDRKPRELGRPALVEVPLDANFVVRHLSSSRDISDACAALPSVSSSTRQVVKYHRCQYFKARCAF
jgi:hypothetical protein